jgi:outer membrane protein OmpA-like peptidoglycan-associated protein
MPVRPMLDGAELQPVQKIEGEDQEVIAQHGVPALEGDFLQDLGRRATRLSLTGVMTGPGAGSQLNTLREKFRAATPVPFVADIATATKVDEVLIEELGLRELAGKPERFEYELTVREFLPPPKPEQQEPPPPPPPPPLPEVEAGILIVEVIVEGQANFDFGRVTVTAEGMKDDGSALSQTLTNRAENVWTEENMALGQFTVRAVVTDPPPMSAFASATVRAGQTTRVQITLRPGAVIAKAFIIHFRFDSAFFEPCMREVLERVFEYSQAHPDEKVVVVGHTDLVGSDDYNQFLSERRARSVFAFLTFGTSAELRAAAIADWDNLRRGPKGGLNDGWGTREYQYMLQDLEYYSGNIDEQHGPKTDAAVRAFQGDNGLLVTGFLNDATWRKLVEAYLEADALAMGESQFVPNANAETGCDGGILKWLGCGEKDPVRNTQDAWRPNRRVEILFVLADKLPCQVPKPVTFDLPAPGAVNSQWCLGPETGADRCCFTARGEAQPNKWLVQPAEPDKITVSGTVTFDDGTPVANEKYVLIAPDGEFLHKNGSGDADLGERPQGPQRGRPIPMRTDPDGNFSHPAQTPVGIYILELPELQDPLVARAKDEPPPAAIGNVVCLRLDISGAR